MELIIATLAILAAFLGLDAAALRFGADSRPRIADDHQR
jgi:hypothetical protein